MKRRNGSSLKTVITVALTTGAFLIGWTQKQASENGESGKTVIELNKVIQASDLPSQFLRNFDSSSAKAATNDLKNRDSLTLDGATLVVGPVGGKQTLTLAANGFRMLNGARIVTNGNNLVLVAVNMEFNNNGGVESFSGDNLKAKLDTAGLDGGRVEIFATKMVSGTVDVRLSGQTGGDGSQGAKGKPGDPGLRGNDAVDGLFDCSQGGGNGGRGGDGKQGLKGLPGNASGNGGELVHGTTSSHSGCGKQC